MQAVEAPSQNHFKDKLKQGSQQPPPPPKKKRAHGIVIQIEEIRDNML